MLLEKYSSTDVLSEIQKLKSKGKTVDTEIKNLYVVSEDMTFKDAEVNCFVLT